jgi:hypothetical protein
MTLTGTYGITDRFEVYAGIPFVRVTLEGQRVDNYRGRQLVQATGSGAAAGLGDIVVRARYNFFRDGASGLAFGGEARLPTGRAEDLLGAGTSAFTPSVIASYEHDRVGVHGEFGYAFDNIANALTYEAAGTVVAAPRVTVIGELLGRRLEGLGRLVDTTLPNPGLVGVDTIRLTGSGESTERLVLVTGFKWNLGSTWLMTGSVLRSLTSVGLNANWVPSITFDYWFGQ